MPIAIPLSMIAFGIGWIVLARWLFARKNADVAAAHATWHAAEGEILSAKIHETSRELEYGTQTEYVPDVRYRFNAGGASYEGDCFDFARRHACVAENTAQKLIAPYPAGTRVQLRHDPADPSRNALTISQPAKVMQWITSAAGLIFIGLGIFAWTL